MDNFYVVGMVDKQKNLEKTLTDPMSRLHIDGLLVRMNKFIIPLKFIIQPRCFMFM